MSALNPSAWATPWSRLGALLPRSRFSRRLALLSGGTSASQLLLIASSPLLTRLFTPAEFGQFAVLAALISIVGPAVALRLEMAIMIVRDEAEAPSVTKLALCVTLAVTLLLTVVMAALEATPLALGRLTGLGGLVWLVPLATLAYSLAQPLSSWSLRTGGFRLNSVTLVSQSVCQILAQCALGLAGTGGLGLGLGFLSGYVLRLVWMTVAVRDSLWPNPAPAVHPRLVPVARRHWRYPALSAPSSLLRLLAQFLPTILVTSLYGPVIGGLFGLGQRVLTSPVRMLGQATSQAFLVEATECDRAGLHRLFARTTSRFFLLGLLWALPLLLLAPWLFALAFGVGWRGAGEMVQILMPLHLARFVVVPVSQIMNILHRHELDLLLAVAVILAVGVSFIAGPMLGLAPLATIGLYSAGSTLAFLVTLLVAWRMVRVAGAATS